MLRPDHLFLHDLTNAHHQDLSRNVEELQHGPERRSSEQLPTASTCLGGLEVENMPVPQICAMLKTDAERGLTEEMARARLAKDGPNQLQQQPRLGLVMLFLLQLTSFLIILLLLAAAASVVVNVTNDSKREEALSYTTSVAILVLVLINASITSYTEHQAGNALDALAKLSQAEVSVLRDGKSVRLPTVEVVRGDVVVLETGDVVPADVRLLSTSDLKVDEKALTGEPEDVPKNTKIKEQTKLTPENMAFSGCPVASGRCTGVVVATGMDTRIGEIAQMMAKEDDDAGRCSCGSTSSKTPLQENVERLGARIGMAAIVMASAVFIAGVGIGTKDPEFPDSPSWMYMILVAVTLAVAGIPEGIPLCMTISLAIGCQEMVRKNVQVRKIAAVETLGSASVICSDKTGTLTEGKMTMTNMWSCGVGYSVTGQGFNPTIGNVEREGHPGTACHADLGVRSTLLAAVLCSDTELFLATDPETGVQAWQYRGNSSEAPLVVAAQKVPLEHPKTTPFTTSFISDAMHTTEEERLRVSTVVDRYSDEALRVLAVAVGFVPVGSALDEELTADEKFDRFGKELVLLGLVASLDPDREGVRDSVVAARGAGIRVVMITGDYLKTAVAIARRVEILQSEDSLVGSAVDCGALRPDAEEEYLPDDEMDALTSSVRVFARAKPADKLQIVKSLQRQGMVCAMTGDGVNDAPALHEARIGVAMGLQGTEVAKGASEMILTDDNFTSIVRAVEKGRAIYAGIQKLVAFVMSVHVAEVIQIFFCVVADIPLMRTPMQILFLIVVTDLPPSIALGMEPAEKDILAQPPRARDEPIVLGWMWLSICLNGLVLAIVIIAIYLISLHRFAGAIFLRDIFSHVEAHETKSVDGALAQARTVAFVALVLSENVRAYVCRSFTNPVWVGLCQNRVMLRAVLVAQAAMLCAVLVPFLSDQVLGLSGGDIGVFGWALACIGPAATLVLCELTKLLTKAQRARSLPKAPTDKEGSKEEEP
ncbi:unnamed protein product [Symbiodinium sp. CCMP2456]|nr:unnamed protein product [Symbiodinium sp. CCMP2456]